MQESIPIIKFVSPEYPIRVALGKLGYGAPLIQTMELDMVQWTDEAQNLISPNRKILKPYTRTDNVYDNQIPHCPGDTAIDCVKMGGTVLTYQANGSCRNMVTNNCIKTCCGNGQKFIVNECYTQFTPALPDGTEIEITALARPKAENGYPMVAEICVTAIAEYVKWMLCFRMRDNRTGACERRWLDLCRIARSNLKRGEWSQQNIEKFGYYWW